MNIDLKNIKIDKETLIKHRFWIGLGICVPLSLAAILILTAFVPADIVKQEKKILLDLKTTKSVQPRNRESHIDEAKTASDKQAAEKAKVWGNAFKEQADLFPWPKAVEDKYGFSNGKGMFAVDIRLKNEDPGAVQGDNVFVGKIEDIGQEKITIQGAKETKEFYKVAEANLSIFDESGRRIWTDIKRGQYATVTFESWKYFNDLLTGPEQQVFAGAYRDGDMLHEILQSVDPVTDGGEGVVQLKGWLYKRSENPPSGVKFITFVDQKWDLDRDISWEAWIAMEDLWIQKELYRMIRLANDYVSAFEPADGSDNAKPPEKAKGKEKGKDKAMEKQKVIEQGGDKVNFAYKFENPYWRIGVTLEEENGKRNRVILDMQNLLPRRQRLDIAFKVKLHKSLEAEKIWVPGEPLNAFGSKDSSRQIKIDLPQGIERQGVFGIEQMLNWETAAVKRIDTVIVGGAEKEALAHRLYHLPMRSFGQATAAAAAPGGQGGGQGPAGQAVMPGKGGGGGGGGAKDIGGVLPGGDAKGKAGGKDAVGRHGLHRVRYLEVTPQSRRVPVALALIVDQDHVDRVMTAFGNSNLRFLTRQVLLNRYPHSIRPPITQPSAKGKGAKAVKGAGSSSSGGGGNDMVGNVEMVLYGIVTLYERFPPRTVAAAP